MMQTVYDKTFYDNQRGGSDASAQSLVPLITELLHPKSVIDIGCGVGKWCAAFKQHGAETVTGLDGPWVKDNDFALPAQDLVTFDFNAAPMPFDIKLPQPKYDLAITLEFIEHIDPEKADALVDFITSVSDVVVAGGAVPGQGGDYHVNEQWPAYWEKLFRARGFEAYDFLRPVVWDMPGVMSWYVQNTIGYFRNGVPAHIVQRTEAAAVARLRHPSALVHPGTLRLALDPWSYTPRTHLQNFVTRLRPKARA